VNVNSDLGLLLDVSLQVGHLKVVVHPVDHEVGEPGVLALTLEQSAEKFEAILSKVVPKDLEGHQGLVVGKRLRELHQAVILNIIVRHVQMNKALVHGNGLRDGFRSVVSALVARQVQRLQAAVLAFEVLGNRVAALERNLVGIQVEHLQSVVLEEVLHQDVAAVVSEQVLAEGQLLETHVVLEHFAEVDGHRLADGLVDRVLDVEFFEGVIA
jgi:hypothetical protein